MEVDNTDIIYLDIMVSHNRLLFKKNKKFGISKK